MPGCCQSCCKGDFGDEKFWYTHEKENELAERILNIVLYEGINSKNALKRWYGNTGEILITDKNILGYRKKNVLAIIANLFKQEKVDEHGQTCLFLSDKVETVIHGNSDYEDVSFNDLWSLEGVIEVKRDNVE